MNEVIFGDILFCLQIKRKLEIIVYRGKKKKKTKKGKTPREK